MGDVVYVSKSRIERKEGPLRVAYLPGESQPVVFSVHGAIAQHYKLDPEKLKERERYVNGIFDSVRVRTLSGEMRQGMPEAWANHSTQRRNSVCCSNGYN
jgi:hypothetical protein